MLNARSAISRSAAAISVPKHDKVIDLYRAPQSAGAASTVATSNHSFDNGDESKVYLGNAIGDLGQISSVRLYFEVADVTTKTCSFNRMTGLQSMNEKRRMGVLCNVHMSVRTESRMCSILSLMEVGSLSCY